MTYIENLKNYVKNGGNLLGTFLTSEKDYDNVGYDVTFPAHLTDVFGISVYEFEPVFESSRANIEFDGKKALNCHWIEELKPESATVIATISDTYRKGSAVITKNSFGKGTAYYMGTMPRDEMFAEFIRKVTDECGIEKVPFSFPESCCVTTRVSEDKTYYFIFNYGKEDVCITLDKEYTVFGGDKTTEIKLGCYEYTCIEA